MVIVARNYLTRVIRACRCWWTRNGSTARAQITSTFENSTLELQYDYVENIGDGRGITAGRAGFTSALAISSS
jgi:hypothetical protein